MPTPKSLKNGDTVAIVATAKRLQPNEIDGAIQLIESWGLNVTTGTHLYDSHHQFAGTDKQRAHDLQNALNDDHIKAVIFARGGYGTCILQCLFFSKTVSRTQAAIRFKTCCLAMRHL